MAEKTLAIGDPVLFYGKTLTVVDVHDKGEVKVVEVTDIAELEARKAAREEILRTRELQQNASGAEHTELVKQIEALIPTADSAVLRAKLRIDLLSWWDEREIWTSEGRILSDDQVAAFEKITGRRPLPEAQRQALDLLQPLAARA